MRSLFRSFSLGLICSLLIASSDATVNAYGYRIGRSLAAAQSSSVVTVYPSAYQTPNPGQFGEAVDLPSNTGHENTSASVFIVADGEFGSASDSDYRSAKWTAFQPVSGHIVSIRLKFNWSVSGNVGASASGDGGYAEVSNGLLIDYSLNGGSSWINRVSRGRLAMGNDFQTFNESGSEEILLSSSQNISQVQVRDLIGISGSAVGGQFVGSSAGGDITAKIWDIRLEVEAVNCIASVPTDRWKGEYFNNQTLEGSPVMVRDDSASGANFLNLNFGSGSPHSLCAPAVDNFSARWTRTVNFAAGAYRFNVTVDDGARLYIDGLKIIDAWVIQAPTTYTADLSLTAGPHEIKLEYFESGGGASVSLFWGDVNCLANVPVGRWKGEYFNGITPTGFPLMIRDDGIGFLNFNFGNGGPGGNCGLGVDNFSARWTRTVNFGSGVYRFSVTVDDGVKLYVDGQLKIDKWFPQGATTYTTDVPLSAGNHEVKLQYFESGGPGIALLSWVDATGVNCLPNAPLPLISSVPQTGGRENIASTAPSQAPKRCDPKIVTAPRAPGSD